MLLASCASAPPAPRADDANAWACGDSAAASVPSAKEQAAVVEGFQPCESSSEDACFSLQCNQPACTLFLQEDTEAGRVVPTRGVGPLRPPTATAQRYWAGLLIPFPWDRPVFIIPWNHHTPLLPSQRKMLEEALRIAQEPHEKHHIFPQEPRLKTWFERQGINTHQETISLDLPTHRRIHLGARGGAWNQAWRDFQDAKPGATKQQMYEHSWELMKRFKLVGFVIPYHDKPPYLLPPPIEY
ncbi:TIGR02269 family lipoprotein [Hyalangium minutum]|uniref:SitA6 family polymorphic toxin lipoprotein n=1 Tax=Hyalangium minutum TaxID=394096 RepID=UPI00146FE5B9|nr:TIGR02269 family lipoprotein [Hyalangium minutum]